MFCVPLIISGCSRTIVMGAPPAESVHSTPTVGISLFDTESSTVSITGSGLFDQSDGLNTTTPARIAPTPPSDGVSGDPRMGIDHSMFQEILIYDEDLESHWTLEHSTLVRFNAWDASHWFESLDKAQALDTGGVVIAVTPIADYATLYFTVKSNANVAYLRNEVVGISFWLNSGNDFMDTDELAVAVIGSNANSYWEFEDYSALRNTQDKFSETRLYYLGVNRSIPPNTWINVVVWLDDLMLDPDYEYLTGFYLKSDEGFLRTYYVDKVTLLAIK